MAHCLPGAPAQYLFSRKTISVIDEYLPKLLSISYTIFYTVKIVFVYLKCLCHKNCIWR